MSTANRKWQCAGVAQLVEQRIRNAQVVGSSPTTSFKSCLIDRTFLFILAKCNGSGTDNIYSE